MQVGDVVRVHKELSRRVRIDSKVTRKERVGRVVFVSPKSKFVLVEFEGYRETYAVRELEVVAEKWTAICTET